MKINNLTRNALMLLLLKTPDFIHMKSGANLTKTVLNFYKKYSWLNVFVFVCVLGDFFNPFRFCSCQIACCLLLHSIGNALKTHLQPAHDKFKTVSQISEKITFLS